MCVDYCAMVYKRIEISFDQLPSIFVCHIVKVKMQTRIHNFINDNEVNTEICEDMLRYDAMCYES